MVNALLYSSYATNINALVGIFPALYDQGERLSAPSCLCHIHSTDPIKRLPDSRAHAVLNTDADTPDA